MTQIPQIESDFAPSSKKDIAQTWSRPKTVWRGSKWTV